jgi:hypothetical protein
MDDVSFEPVNSFPPRRLAAPPLDYKLGFTRMFGTSDIALSGLCSGWSVPEATHNWNDGNDASLALWTHDLPMLPCILAVEGLPFLAGGGARQRITLYANGRRLGFWHLTESRMHFLEAAIEPEYWLDRDAGGLLNLVWHFPDAVKPVDLGRAEDHRKLGFCFRSLTIDYYPP